MMDTPESAEPSRSSLPDPNAVPAVAPRGNALPAGFRLGDFEVEDVIGVGGFGIVYRARDVHLRRLVAIKEYMPGFLADRTREYAITVKSESAREAFVSGLRSFVNEARLLAQFEHPALVSVLSYWEDRGTAYMVMPYYSGPTLKRFLQDAPRPSEAWIQTIFEPLLDVLGLLHGARCYHRDVAPDNILMLGKGTPLLLDLGAARQVMGDATQALTAILKPTYAPIEQYSTDGDLRQGPWTDIYACAGVLHWVVSGEPPPTAVRRMLTADLPLLTTLAPGAYSPRLLEGIRAGLRLMPADRPQDVEAFRALLFAPRDAVTVATGLARAAVASDTAASEATILAPGSAAGAPTAPAESAAPPAETAAPKTRASRSPKPKAAKAKSKGPEAPPAGVPSPVLGDAAAAGGTAGAGITASSREARPEAPVTPDPSAASEARSAGAAVLPGQQASTPITPTLSLQELLSEAPAPERVNDVRSEPPPARSASPLAAQRPAMLPWLAGAALLLAVAGYVALHRATPAPGSPVALPSPGGAAPAAPAVGDSAPGATTVAPVAQPNAPAAGSVPTLPRAAASAPPPAADQPPGAGQAASGSGANKVAAPARDAARRHAQKPGTEPAALAGAAKLANSKRCAQANLDVAAGMDTPADLQLLRESCGPPTTR